MELQVFSVQFGPHEVYNIFISYVHVSQLIHVQWYTRLSQTTFGSGIYENVLGSLNWQYESEPVRCLEGIACSML